MAKKTDNGRELNNNSVLTKIISAIIPFSLYAVFIGTLVKAFHFVYTTPQLPYSGDILPTGVVRIIYLSIIGMCLLGIIGLLMNHTIIPMLGKIKGKIVLNIRNWQIKKTNKLIYCRELPNSFGIGIASLLFDSTIENEKDIVAVILDLCARKYLHLIKQNNKYMIKVLKNADDNLLNNEKYILNLIISNQIKNINYKEWFRRCVKDGIELGLYYYPNKNINNEPYRIDELIKRRKKIRFLISLIAAGITFLVLLDTYPVIVAIMSAILIFIIFAIGLIIPFLIFNILTTIKNAFKRTVDINYQSVLNNSLTRTQKGVEELHKLDAFRDFIKDFGYFVDKTPNEVVLWDRYLSYAHVFGLTKEIMESGYKEIVDNASFHIDNMDNINLSNVELE